MKKIALLSACPAKAAKLDPDFATAHGMAAYCYVCRQQNGWTTDRPKELAEIMRHAERVTGMR
jgi:hypothetical protein